MEARAKILLTEDAPSYGVLAGIRALASVGHEVWLAVGERGGYGERSRARAGLVHVPDPAAEPRAYVETLAAAAREHEIPVVLPGTDLALAALAGSEQAFEETVVGICAPETVALAGDKARLPKLAERAGLRTPPTTELSLTDPAGLAAAPLPAIVKAPASAPAAGRRGAGPPARRVQSRSDLQVALEHSPDGRLLLQPWVPGRLAAVCGVAFEGELVCAVHQVSDRIFPPDCGISAYARTVPVDVELERGVARLVELIGWSGIFQAQFLGDGEERVLIDFNPRMYGSLALAVAAGANLPAIWTQLLLGDRPGRVTYQPGVRFRSEERDAGALATALARRDWRTLLQGLPRRGTVHAVFSVRDPLPALRSLRRIAFGAGLVRRSRAR